MVLSEGNMSLKNLVTPRGIDPGTVRLVAQRLNHYATPGPLLVGVFPIIKDERLSFVNHYAARVRMAFQL
jgi:hypothetical protein